MADPQMTSQENVSDHGESASHRPLENDVHDNADGGDDEPVCLDVLSSEQLRYIVGNDRYKNVLSYLLAPFVDDKLREESVSDVVSGSSADHTVADDWSE